MGTVLNSSNIPRTVSSNNANQTALVDWIEKTKLDVMQNKPNTALLNLPRPEAQKAPMTWGDFLRDAPPTREHFLALLKAPKFRSNARISSQIKPFNQHQFKNDSKNDNKQRKPPSTRTDQTNLNASLFATAARRGKIRGEHVAPTISISATEREERRRKQEIPVVHLAPEPISARQLAMQLKDITPSQILEALAELGEHVDDQDLPFDVTLAELVVLHFDRVFQIVDGAKEEDARRRPIPEDLDEAGWQPRPPVVCVMGHVNHGKTTLLDTLRKTSVAQSEHGGITQSIGAFVVGVGDRTMTVMDTPGHAAFRHMRALGAHLTDVVVLVVAADDGVMPQTKEAIQLIQGAGLPVVVALNKCDKFKYNIKNIKKQLLSEGLDEQDVLMVPISAKTGEGVDELLENIFYTTDTLELKADYEGYAEGIIVESKVDRGVGHMMNLIVDRGVLRVGDVVVSGTNYGKVRQLLDHTGKDIMEAGPSTPVSVVGVDGVPEAGCDVLVVKDLETAERIVEYRKLQQKRLAAAQSAFEQRELAAGTEDEGRRRRRTLRWRDKFEELREQAKLQSQLEALQSEDALEQREQLLAMAKQAKRLGVTVDKLTDSDSNLEVSGSKSEGVKKPLVRLVIKADNHGSLKAITDFIDTIPRDEVDLKVLVSGVGEITQTDVQSAALFKASVFGFNVEASEKVANDAKSLQVSLKSQRLIYSLFDDIRDHVSEFLTPDERQEVTSTAEVVQMFSLHGKRKQRMVAAGCRIKDGTFSRSAALYRVMRAGEIIHEGSIMSLKLVKQEVNEVKKGSECGIVLQDFHDFERGDFIQHVTTRKIKRLIHIPVFDLNQQFKTPAFNSQGRYRVSGSSSSETEKMSV
eukprot:TRINITY_DN2200_c0_g1_i6.p1 TRINITY_DN2200_c0_g1~~TRINITY_DN2200_c0_g1_i6.p1  ORF type:complete len:864 (+),score=221.90 TRINITY_DN2200_c0_g1_i6:143-2734(+)